MDNRKDVTPTVVGGLVGILGCVVILIISSRSPHAGASTTKALFPDNSADTLGFLAIILAFMAYVAVNEGGILRAFRRELQRNSHTERVRFGVPYACLIVADVLLIVLSMLLLSRLLPLMEIYTRVGSSWWIATLTWFAAALFTAFHLRNWLRGYALLTEKTLEHAAETGLCRGSYYVITHTDGRLLLAAIGSHETADYRVWLEASGGVYYLRYRKETQTGAGTGFCSVAVIAGTPVTLIDMVETRTISSVQGVPADIRALIEARAPARE